MDKAYNHKDHEEKIYKLWEESGAFSPTETKTDKTFCIVMPPPNANDNLHIGHARFVTIEDVLIRYHRMLGEATLWIPGADHAGIETQFVFEKKLKEQGKSRFDYADRDSLYGDIWNYVQKNKSNMENQLRSLGASCDWSRNKFTLDPDIVKVVYKTFKKMSNDGLLYRGEKLVNYCTRCGTAYSELEVDHVEKEGEIYTLDYGLIKIATTRPETIFADVAVAVNPKDEKYKALIGKMAVVPIINKEIPIIADEAVELGLGTDALKVTPAHDFTDWEIGERHHLESIKVVDFSGKLIAPAPEKYQGKYVNEARKLVVEDLLSQGKLLETKKKEMILSVCYRCKNPIEPLPSLQWFVKVVPLVKAAKEAVESGETVFAADKYRKIYMNWLDNLKDWNISRQIVWGIRIPAWHCTDCDKWTITEGQTPKTCDNCGGLNIRQDDDTFDTWFSSGQWPFAVLKTNNEGDYERFYPTSVMETAYDILPFWVMRMMMLGLYTTGKVPFETVLIHGLIRDKNGQKISKSKGNVINPLDMTEKYGTDALRNAVIWGALVENDISLSEENIKGQKNFANKIWNAARFVQSFTEVGSDESEKALFEVAIGTWIKETSEHLDNYRLSQAIEYLYNEFWHTYCDVWIEKAKVGKLGKDDLERGLFTFLKLLHPFMPFVTEVIWQELKQSESPTLISTSWPKQI